MRTRETPAHASLLLQRPSSPLPLSMHSTFQRLQNVSSFSLSVLFALLFSVALSSFALLPATLPSPARLDVDPFNVYVSPPLHLLNQF